MHKIALMAQKGGAGKTTLTIHLAVAAHLSGLKVAVIDVDPQKSIETWSHLREDKSIPVASVLSMNIHDSLEMAQEESFDLVLIDTPPHTAPLVPKIASLVDYIVIPCQPSILDIDATRSTARIIKAAGKLYCGVITRAPSKGFEVEACREALLDMDIPVCPTVIRDRIAYKRALHEGKAVLEFERSGKAAQEIDELWSFLKKDIKI